MGLIAYKKGDKWNEKLTKDFYTCFENIHTKQLKSIHINKLKKNNGSSIINYCNLLRFGNILKAPQRKVNEPLI